jgi:hypothetical protein
MCRAAPWRKVTYFSKCDNWNLVSNHLIFIPDTWSWIFYWFCVFIDTK